MALLRNGANRYQFRMKQENELKSLLTDQQFEASDNRELLLAQAKACANGYALATEGIAVVSDFQNNNTALNKHLIVCKSITYIKKCL